ncbi:hypothetical protein M569_08870, partial [Genlisea aurea]
DGEKLTPATQRRDREKKAEVYGEVLRRLKESGHPQAVEPAFPQQLWDHFNSLPSRYAVDVNLERAGDVITHKQLLQLARDPNNGPAFDVRLVQVVPISEGNSEDSHYLTRGSVHPPPAFGSSPNLEASQMEPSQVGDIRMCNNIVVSRPMHEITFSTKDRPKLLSQLTSLLAEIGLNIQEAHAFSTVDGFSLDVFVVDGWPFEEVEELRIVLRNKLLKIERSYESKTSSSSVINPMIKQEKVEIKSLSDHHHQHLTIPSDGTDVWEIDPHLLEFEAKVASGSYGDLYKGIYRSQEVAIKILKAECVTEELQKEFAQEVYIMRKVRHKNVVQFIGACTRHPNLCIVTEYMQGGSLYDFLHKQKGSFKLPTLLKVGIDISKGMNYLHQNNIIHRDLKTANLLMDENDVVKVGDFGVARVKAQTGVMTAETGTYRWMAPEIIEHKPYDHKADVFSFGVVLWELLTGKLPYDYLTPLQAAVGVVQNGLRPTIPKQTHPKLAHMLERCWQQDPSLRPDFSEITGILKKISEEIGDDGEGRKEKGGGGIFSAFKR